ncbi:MULTISPECIES: TetR/AcrR family transcriptional regulator [Streptomyces]|uniref:TetR/AcrR family transcriptional regulator n=1 Tax=Streptomyces TaxID=1883 RepID=UPI0019625097|nr:MULTISPECIES: TetR/AcrR family transcriptional regulator [Streptomyces]QRX90034.1 TetR/AcrR family transcriptional regulator C-terminal domain-containing protein [Streptomyces noursei]UJB39970.1 TetR/AcrR family transcriptional regulator [Streptomyces sp. A1-5]
MTEESTAADPGRTVELLWGATEGHGRTGLHLAGIVAAAIEVADADGLAALSMRRVAERLGFTTMSLYRHVPGKAELIELMRDAVAGELDRAAPEHVEPDGGNWRSGMEAWARAHWALHLRHPWFVHTAGSRRLPGPNIMADYDRALRIAEGTGLPASQVIAVVQLVGGFVKTAALQVHEVLREERESGVSQTEWWRGREELVKHLPPYPALGRLWQAGGFDEPEDPFDFGLARTLDGVELLVRRLSDEKRDVTAEQLPAGRCSVCGTEFDGARRGRPRDYCSRACQQRAYRQRRSAT